MGIARQHLYYKCETGNKCRGRYIASLREGGGYVIIRSATPHKKQINQYNNKFVFLRERRSLERKKYKFGQKDRLHAFQGVKCSYHTNILNGG